LDGADAAGDSLYKGRAKRLSIAAKGISVIGCPVATDEFGLGGWPNRSVWPILKPKKGKSCVLMLR